MNKINWDGTRHFATISSKNHGDFFSGIIKSTSTTGLFPKDHICRPYVRLFSVGLDIAAAIKDIPRKYPGVEVDKYVIMPTHIHMILVLGRGGESDAVPSAGEVIEDMKQTVSARYPFPVWENAFESVLINSDDDYRGIVEYIERNPLKWYNNHLRPGQAPILAAGS